MKLQPASTSTRPKMNVIAMKSRAATNAWLTSRRANDVRYCQSARMRAPTRCRYMTALAARSPTLHHHLRHGPRQHSSADEHQHHQPQQLHTEDRQHPGASVLAEEDLNGQRHHPTERQDADDRLEPAGE